MNDICRSSPVPRVGNAASAGAIYICHGSGYHPYHGYLASSYRSPIALWISIVSSSRIALIVLPRSGIMERDTVSLTDLIVNHNVHSERSVGDPHMDGRITD